MQRLLRPFSETGSGGDALGLSRAGKLNPHKKLGFQFQVNSWHDNRLTMSLSGGDAFSLSRSAENLGDGHDGCVQMTLVIDGVLMVSQRGHELKASAGQAVLMLASEPYELITSNGNALLSVHFDGGLFIERGLSPDRLASEVLDLAGAGEPVLALARMAVDQGQAQDPGYAGNIRRAMVDLLAGAAYSHLGKMDHGDRNATEIQSRIEEVLDASFTDPGLTAQLIAKAVGMSRRSLYRLFAGRTESVLEGLKRRRLSHARDLLITHPHMSLLDIALASGFGGAAQLSRSFKELHGVSPSEFRKFRLTGNS